MHKMLTNKLSKTTHCICFSLLVWKLICTVLN